MARGSLGNVLRLIEAESAEVPIESQFLSDLKRAIELQNQAESRAPSQTYKPSSMNCIRNMWYQVNGAEQDEGVTPFTLVGICNVGSDIHERIQSAVVYMQECGIDCEYVDVAEYLKSREIKDIKVVKKSNFAKGNFETKLLHKKLNMSFLCDGIIRYKDKYYILELKSEGVNKFYARKGVDTKHYNQGTAYSVAFDIADVLFVYICRDSLDMKAYMFTPTDDMKQTLVGTIDECEQYRKNGVLPPKPEDIDRRNCQYCPYVQKCRNDES